MCPINKFFISVNDGQIDWGCERNYRACNPVPSPASVHIDVSTTICLFRYETGVRPSIDSE